MKAFHSHVHDESLQTLTRMTPDMTALLPSNVLHHKGELHLPRTAVDARSESGCGTKR